MWGTEYVVSQPLTQRSRRSLAGKRFELNDKQRFQLVSSFIFLRYFLPAVLVPDAHGVADRDLSKTQRRPLILVRVAGGPCPFVHSQ